MRSRTLLVFFASWLVTIALGAQYISPGSISSGTEIPAEGMLRVNLEEARWRLGVIRLDPWVGVRNASFVTSNTIDGEDLTATLGAGLRGYLKTGRRLIWAAHALPEYVWWQSNEEKESLNGRYGLGLFAYFNRLDLELSVRRAEQQGFFSSEIQELTSTRRETARLKVQLELADRIFLVGDVSSADFRGEEQGTLFTSLDRETKSARLGLLYKSPRGWWASAGVEDLEEDFAETARSLSHTGDVGIFGFGYEGSGSFGLSSSLEYRSLEAGENSSFVDRDVTTGIVETLWVLHRNVDLLVYGRRKLSFSVRSENSSILSERFGLRFDVRMRGSLLDMVAEIGEDDYQPIAGVTGDRLDDVTTLGARLSFSVRRSFYLNLGVVHTEYDSNLDAADFDRDVTAWTATIQLGALRDKLRLGEGEQVW